MRILDLFCGAGGASMGYHQAWPDARISGIDIEPQPDYPFDFWEMNALAISPKSLLSFDLIHASPPCQAFSTATPEGHDHPDLIAATRTLIDGHRYVIENVVQAPLRRDLVLCGSMFGLQVQRHRAFELGNLPLILAPAHNHHEWEDGRPWTVTGDGGGGEYAHSKKHRSLEHAAELMGMPWVTTLRGITEAIPPAYTRFIAEQIGEVR